MEIKTVAVPPSSLPDLLKLFAFEDFTPDYLRQFAEKMDEHNITRYKVNADESDYCMYTAYRDETEEEVYKRLKQKFEGNYSNKKVSIDNL